jgi:hypothetical protein
VNEALWHCQEFRKAVAEQQAALPGQTSLAAFQGIDMRVKKALAAFKPQVRGCCVRGTALCTRREGCRRADVSWGSGSNAMAVHFMAV